MMAKCDPARNVLLDLAKKEDLTYQALQAQIANFGFTVSQLQQEATNIRQCRQVLIDLNEPDYGNSIESLSRVIERKDSEAVALSKTVTGLQFQAANTKQQRDNYQAAADELQSAEPIQAHVAVIPTTVARGDGVTLNGDSFSPSVQVLIELVQGSIAEQPGPPPIGTVVDSFTRTTDFDGRFSAFRTISNQRDPGNYHFRFTAAAHDVPPVNIVVTQN